MRATATAKYLNTTARKLGVVLDLIRGKPIEEALQILRFCRRAAARMVEKALRSAIANANQGEARLNLDLAHVVGCSANLGGSSRNARRFMPRAMGRAASMRSRLGHLRITISDETANASKV